MILFYGRGNYFYGNGNYNLLPVYHNALFLAIFTV